MSKELGSIFPYMTPENTKYDGLFLVAIFMYLFGGRSISTIDYDHT